jgi:hypothetical protein
VDAERGRGSMVVGGDVDTCARQLLGCRLVVPKTSCPWWPSFPGSPSLGACSLHRETDSKICAVVAPVLGSDQECHCRSPGGDNLDGEGPHRQGAGWQCYAPAADCGCPDRSLTTKVLSMFGWTIEGPWVSSRTRLCAGGALRIWHTFQTADRALGGSWVGP